MVTSVCSYYLCHQAGICTIHWMYNGFYVFILLMFVSKGILADETMYCEMLDQAQICHGLSTFPRASKGSLTLKVLCWQF